jgi:S1-C subfamily serine protease
MILIVAQVNKGKHRNFGDNSKSHHGGPQALQSSASSNGFRLHPAKTVTIVALPFTDWKGVAALVSPIAISLLILPIALGQVSLTTAQIAKKVAPSVVVIQGKTDSGDVLGSGFIVSKDGKIVTNLHVIRDLKAGSVQLANGEIFDSISVLATDERRDLAIIHVAGFDLVALDLGNSKSVTVGEPVVIVGSPRGLGGTVTAGILSSVRDGGNGFKVLQTDAAVNPGNSGGPLVNGKGQVIGVVSFKLRSSEGLNFAVPINYVAGLLSEPHDPMSLEQMRKSLSPKATNGQSGASPSLSETLDWLKEKIPLAANHYVAVIDPQTDGPLGILAEAQVGKWKDVSETTIPRSSVIVPKLLQPASRFPSGQLPRWKLPKTAAEFKFRSPSPRTLKNGSLVWQARRPRLFLRKPTRQSITPLTLSLAT